MRTLEGLQKMTKRQLQTIAREDNVGNVEALKKADMIKVILRGPRTIVFKKDKR